MDLQRKFEPLPSAFERQFGIEDGQLVYRLHQKGPAIAVSEKERTVFQEHYQRSRRRAYVGLVTGLLILTFAYVGYAMAYDIDLEQDWTSYIALSAVMAASLWVQLRAFTYPARALSDRTPVAPARAKLETRRLMVRQTSWAQLVLGLLFVVIIGWAKLVDPETGTGWRWFWGGLIVLTLFGAVRTSYLKWRHGPDPSQPGAKSR